MATAGAQLQIYGRHKTPSSDSHFESDEGIVCATRNCGVPCVASWGWSRSQGLGCSPIKAARELGLERRSLRLHGVIRGCPPAHIGGTRVHPPNGDPGNTEGSSVQLLTSQGGRKHRAPYRLLLVRDGIHCLQGKSTDPIRRRPLETGRRYSQCP